jgi:hypothetical protein
MADDTMKLDETDAGFVDIIHTDGGDNFLYATHLGMGQVMGHADFYVNSGIFQPGCPTSSLPSYEGMREVGHFLNLRHLPFSVSYAFNVSSHPQKCTAVTSDL